MRTLNAAALAVLLSAVSTTFAVFSGQYLRGIAFGMTTIALALLAIAFAIQNRGRQ